MLLKYYYYYYKQLKTVAPRMADGNVAAFKQETGANVLIGHEQTMQVQMQAK